MRIESPQGSTVLPVRFSTDLRRGELFAPIHWTDLFTSGGPIDAIVGAATDPISGQPELKATPVRVIALAPQWHGLLMRSVGTVPPGPYYWGGCRSNTAMPSRWPAGSRCRPIAAARPGSRRCSARRHRGAGDLCRSRTRHIPLCQHGGDATRRLPVHRQEPRRRCRRAMRSRPCSAPKLKPKRAPPCLRARRLRRIPRARHLRLLRRRPADAARRDRKPAAHQRRRNRRRAARRDELRFVHSGTQGHTEQRAGPGGRTSLIGLLPMRYRFARHGCCGLEHGVDRLALQCRRGVDAEMIDRRVTAEIHI